MAESQPPKPLSCNPMTQPNPTITRSASGASQNDPTKPDETVEVDDLEQDPYPPDGPPLRDGEIRTPDLVEIPPPRDPNVEQPKTYDLSIGEMKRNVDPKYHPPGMLIPPNCDVINGRWVMRSNQAITGRTHGVNKNTHRYPLKLFRPGNVVRNLGDKNRGTISDIIEPYFCRTRGEWCMRVIWHADGGSVALNLEYSFTDYPFSQVVPDIDLPRNEQEHLDIYSKWAMAGQPIQKLTRTKQIETDSSVSILRRGDKVPYYVDDVGKFLCRDPKEKAIWIRPLTKEGEEIPGMEDSSQMVYNVDLGQLPKKTELIVLRKAARDSAPKPSKEFEKKRKSKTSNDANPEQLNTLEAVVGSASMEITENQPSPSSTPMSNYQASNADVGTDEPDTNDPVSDLHIAHSDDGSHTQSKDGSVQSKRKKPVPVSEQIANQTAKIIQALEIISKQCATTVDADRTRLRSVLGSFSNGIISKFRECIDGEPRDPTDKDYDEEASIQSILVTHLALLRNDITNDVVAALKPLIAEALAQAQSSQKSQPTKGTLPQSPARSVTTSTVSKSIKQESKLKRVKAENPQTAHHNPYAATSCKVPGTLSLGEIPENLYLSTYFTKSSLARIREKVLEIKETRRHIQCRAKYGFKTSIDELAKHKHHRATYGYDAIFESLKLMIQQTKSMKTTAEVMEHLKTNPWLWAILEFLKEICRQDDKLFTMKQLKQEKGKFKWIPFNLRQWLIYAKLNAQHTRNDIKAGKIAWETDNEDSDDESKKPKPKKMTTMVSTVKIRPIVDPVTDTTVRHKPGPRFHQLKIAKKTSATTISSDSDNNGDSEKVALAKRKEKMPSHKRQLKLQGLEASRQERETRRKIEELQSKLPENQPGSSKRKYRRIEEPEELEKPETTATSTPTKLVISGRFAPLTDDEKEPVVIKKEKSVRDVYDGEFSDDNDEEEEEVDGLDYDESRVGDGDIPEIEDNEEDA